MLPHLLAAVLLSATASPGKAKIAVLELTAAGEVDPAIAKSLTEAVTAELDARGYFEPLSSAEIATLLGVERQKQLLGCSDTSCVAELAGALGAPYLMSGSLARLGDVYQLNVQVIDTVRAHPVGRSTKVARNLEALRALLPWAVAEACGTPLPPPPSRVLPYSLIAAGGAAVIAGGVLGIMALNNESVVRGELSADDTNGTVVLRTADHYQARLQGVAMMKTLSLVTLLVGAVMVAGGVWLMPPDAPQTGVKVALVPALNGLGLGGSF